MSKRPLAALTLGAVLACTVPVQAQTKTTLPLRKIRLRETGLGSFERTGPLSKGVAGLLVPTAHLDDAMETLVVLDADGESTGARDRRCTGWATKKGGRTRVRGPPPSAGLGQT